MEYEILFKVRNYKKKSRSVILGFCMADEFSKTKSVETIFSNKYNSVP